VNGQAGSRDSGPVAAVVVTYRSADVIGRCLEALLASAPRRGVALRVVDNASGDGTVERAQRVIGSDCVIRLDDNRGFAAGVNAGLAAVRAPWIAVINPDAFVPPGGLDRLADVLDSDPRAGLVGPRVRDTEGRPEPTAGLFPTLARERAHAWMLDRLIGLEGRRATFPERTAPVDWVSGCAWVLRAEAVRDVGQLDETYFMYYEDVDYCRRLHDRNWNVLATPDVEVVHRISTGSDGTARLPADGGAALVRYFRKFHPETSPEAVQRLLRRGWGLRRAWRLARARMGHAPSAGAAERYRLAIESLERG
jgi:GT2 family glycosyltransferase